MGREIGEKVLSFFYQRVKKLPRDLKKKDQRVKLRRVC